MFEKKFGTDLAAEARSAFMQDYATSHGGEPDGVCYAERGTDGVSVSEINIINENGERLLGKARGSYITIGFGDTAAAGYEDFRAVCSVCAGEIKRVASRIAPEAKSLMVCGIGNERITPDAIGPQALRHILITRRLKEEAPHTFRGGGFFDVCAMAPGVSADTGMCAADMIRAAAKFARPDVIIAIDALAAKSRERLCRTVQISSAGISPGAGVGNASEAINAQSMGAPVIAIGVPTVIDAASLADGDASARGFFVCPTDIDAQTERLSRLIGFAVNMAFHEGYPINEMLLG